MKIFSLFVLAMLFFNVSVSFAQLSSTSAILNIILHKYYKNEKPVYKNRRQLLYFYCEKANNNEELLEATKKANLSKDYISEIKISLKTNISNENWSNNLNEIYSQDQSNIKEKINDCQNLENYQEISKKTKLNNQRLLIISKPIFYSKQDLCIIKITFYRSIEHNNGLILLLEKKNDTWIIKDELNVWET